MKAHFFKVILWSQLLACPSILAADAGGFKISRFLGTGNEANMVLLEAGRQEGIVTGDVFRIYRPSLHSTRDLGIPVETGEAKAVMVYDHKTIAQITVQSTPLSNEVFPKFASVMAGDIALKQNLTIKRTFALSPEVSLTYGKIFEDPNALPQSFELSPTGRTLLTSQTSDLASLKTGLLMIIGHTDSRGSSEANQIESYQRALVVRQYMVDELGFDPERVVAIGKGEDELPEEDLTPGFAQRARRIVVKVVSNPQS